ncbi:rRNA maturation RNase YbeY [Paludibacterium yongneupense]|uniref:rRNA maturation RNase YbeY n=1 Tax=Paludibacterium yongneupense TaxID=400061 RepID=UPI0003FBE620|nr:rRNA maturation RNase YbeY [Paludibacterium yongneupense]
MKRAKRYNPVRQAAERLTLSIQFATAADGLPSAADLTRWALAALRPGRSNAEVNLRLVAADEARALNRDFRGKDYATNVLTFALHEDEDEGYATGQDLFGDIVLSTDVVASEATAQGIALSAHYAHLVVHGMLHLQGFDHEEDDEAQIMEALETVIMLRLGYSDPYAMEKA